MSRYTFDNWSGSCQMNFIIINTLKKHNFIRLSGKSLKNFVFFYRQFESQNSIFDNLQRHELVLCTENQYIHFNLTIKWRRTRTFNDIFENVTQRPKIPLYLYADYINRVKQFNLKSTGSGERKEVEKKTRKKNT